MTSFQENQVLLYQVNNMDMKVGEIRNRVRGIATEKDVAKIIVYSVVDRPGIASSLFEPLAQADISVDVIVQNSSVEGKTDLTFTVKQSQLDRATSVVKKVADELGSGQIGIDENLGKVSVVGTGMQDSPGYAAKMFKTLATSGINIEMITTSEIRITCIVKVSELGKAASALHDAFEMDFN